MLISLPWGTNIEPSLGLAILKAVLQRSGVRCRVRHLSMFLLSQIRADTYQALGQAYALNDFLFSYVLDPRMTDHQRRLLRRKAQELIPLLQARRFGGFEGVVATLLKLREEIFPAWLGYWADEIAASDATLIGFTCMFDQTIASLALARLIRDRAPHKTLVLGGYAVRSPTAEMLIRACPWIDAVCDGEGENAIVGLARASAGECRIQDVPGVVTRSAAGALVVTAKPPQVDLDDNSIPEFDDFFADVKELSERHRIEISPRTLPLENSRGCWWGAKHHCVFCGIQDQDLVYRHRRPDRVLDTLDQLSARHKITGFRFMDYILPSSYYASLLPALAKYEGKYSIRAEVKANISAEQFDGLKAAGFVEIQPGIESFSSFALKSMDKGVSATRNIHTLVQGRSRGIVVFYNLLFGFPTDRLGDYQQMSQSIPRLAHLNPPVTVVPVQITRFAPLQIDPERFGVPRAKPQWSYELIFSREHLEDTGFALDKYCYYFDRPFNNSVALTRVYEEIQHQAANWWKRKLEDEKRPAQLYLERNAAFPAPLIHDSRGKEELVYELTPEQAEVLELAARPTTIDAIARVCRPDIDVAAVIAKLDELALIFIEDRSVVSLLLAGRRPDPPEPVAETQSPVAELA